MASKGDTGAGESGRVVAITGARTFLGTELIRRLEVDPTFDKIIAFDIREPDVAAEQTSFVKLDLTVPTAHADLAAALHEHGVDTVVHGAFLTYPTHARSWAHELEDIGTLHVLDACAKVMPSRLLMLSSTLVYGARPDNPNYLVEDAPFFTGTEPRYIADKVRAERQVAEFADRHPECHVGVLRFAPIIGPSVLNWVTRLLSKPFALRLQGRDPLMQVIHQSDAIAALTLALAQPFRGALNIVGRGVLPYSTVLALLGRIPLPLPLSVARPLARLLWSTQIAHIPPEFVDFLRYLCVADGSRAQDVIGYKPRFDVKQTLLDFLGVGESEGRTQLREAVGMSAGHRKGNGVNGRAPDAGVPEALSASGIYDDVVLGGEAAVPTRDFGPPIPSVLPNEDSVRGQVRELERRLRKRLSPLLPLETRQPIPLRSLWRRYREFALRGRSEVVDSFGLDPTYVDRVRPLLSFLYKRYFRVDASGLSNIPTNGPAILVANHSGPVPYDVAMLIEAVRRALPHRRLRPLVEDELFHAPYIGAFLSRIGAVRACQANALRLLEGGALIVVFPEGKKGSGKLFKKRYQLQRFGRGGYVKLAQKSSAPIIPVAVVGGEETHPVLARLGKLTRPLGLPSLPLTPTFPWLGPAGMLPLPSKWALSMGEPVRVPDDEPNSRVVISELSAKIRQAVQDQLRELLQSRGSAFFG